MRPFIFLICVAFLIGCGQSNTNKRINPDNDKKQISQLIENYFAYQVDTLLNKRFDLLTFKNTDSENRNQLVNQWAHSLQVLELDNIETIDFIENGAIAVVSIKLNSVFGSGDTIIRYQIQTKKVSDEWKIVYNRNYKEL